MDVQRIPYLVNKKLVRGLDYYTRTTFEFVHHGLGAQSGIGGGGRYDQLMKLLGGQDLSGIGFGLGVDRALLAAESEGIDLAAKLISPIAVLATEPAMTKLAFAVSAELRQAGFVVDQVTNAKNLKTGLKIAARLGAAAAVIIGPDEVATGVYAVKMLDSGVQITAGLGELGSVIAQHLALVTKAT